MNARERIPERALLAGAGLGAEDCVQRALTAVADGLLAAGLPAPDACALPSAARNGPALQRLLADLRFDTRMHSARALILVVGSLRERQLQGSAAFELATRARQAGVPCYALAGENRLSAFEQRIMDLQLVLEARTALALEDAARTLAPLL